MAQTAVKKLCLLCGEDVTHKDRHKNRHGEYFCRQCSKSRKKLFRRHGLKTLIKRSRSLLPYALLAVVGSLAFLKFLAAMNQSGG